VCVTTAHTDTASSVETLPELGNNMVVLRFLYGREHWNSIKQHEKLREGRLNLKCQLGYTHVMTTKQMQTQGD